jgi:ribonuclease D
LIDLLANSDVEKVGVAIRDDIKGLQKLKNFKPGGFIELQNMAPKYNIDVLSLKNLAGTLLGFRISKRQRLSNWEANQLTEGQILYAATDAWVSLKIYNTLKNLNPVNPNADNDSQSKKDPKE